MKIQILLLLLFALFTTIVLSGCLGRDDDPPAAAPSVGTCSGTTTGGVNLSLCLTFTGAAWNTETATTQCQSLTSGTYAMGTTACTTTLSNAPRVGCCAYSPGTITAYSMCYYSTETGGTFTGLESTYSTACSSAAGTWTAN